MAITDAQFWLALLQIIWINILLSGDNAVVIALAARNLPAKQRRIAAVGGTLAAIVMRIIFTATVVYLMSIPYLKLVGSVLLFWIAVKLLILEEGDSRKKGKIGAVSTITAAIAAIMIADSVMSLDNVVAIATVADDNMMPVVIGLAVSIPLVVYGSMNILRFMDRYPILVMGSGALLGWVAGAAAADDPAVAPYLASHRPMIHYAAGIAGAAFVILTARGLSAKQCFWKTKLG